MTKPPVIGRTREEMAQRLAQDIPDGSYVNLGIGIPELVAKFVPAGCIDLIYIDPPFNSNRNYEVFWGETKEKRSFEDRHESTKAYIDYMRRAASSRATDAKVHGLTRSATPQRRIAPSLHAPLLCSPL